jgi:integrase
VEKQKQKELYHYEEAIDRIVFKLKELDEKTFESVSRFIRTLKMNNYSACRMHSLIDHIWLLRKYLGKDFNDLTKTDIENFLMNLSSDTHYKESSKMFIKGTLKFFMRWLKTGKTEGAYPEEVDWIKTNIKKSRMKAPNSILTENEIILLSEQADNPMEKAFVLCLYESGCRISEFLNMKFKDIQQDNFGYFVLVSGKTGWRRIRIIKFKDALTKWMDIHPTKESEDYLWLNPRNEHRMLITATKVLLKKLGEKSGIMKHTNAHAFRHARATILARDMKEQELKVYFGWTGNSDMASVYVHLSGEDTDKTLFRINNITEKEQENNITKTDIRTCSVCGQTNTIHSNFCSKCNNPLTIKSIAFEEERRQKFEDIMIDFFKYYSEKDKDFEDILNKFAEDKGYLDFFKQKEKENTK